MYMLKKIMMKKYLMETVIYMLVMMGEYLMETVMYMLVIMVKLPRGIMVRKSGSTPGSLSIRWNVLVFRDMLENTK